MYSSRNQVLLRQETLVAFLLPDRKIAFRLHFAVKEEEGRPVKGVEFLAVEGHPFPDDAAIVTNYGRRYRPGDGQILSKGDDATLFVGKTRYALFTVLLVDLGEEEPQESWRRAGGLIYCANAVMAVALEAGQTHPLMETPVGTVTHE